MNFQVLFLLALISFNINSQSVDEIGCDSALTGDKQKTFQLTDQNSVDDSYTIQGKSTTDVLSIIVSSKNGNLRVDISSQSTPLYQTILDQSDDLEFIDVRLNLLLVRKVDNNGTILAYRIYQIAHNSVTTAGDIHPTIGMNSFAIGTRVAKKFVFIDSNYIIVDFSTSTQFCILFVPTIYDNQFDNYDCTNWALDLSSQAKVVGEGVLYSASAGGLVMYKGGGQGMVPQNISEYLTQSYDQFDFKLFRSTWVFFYSIDSTSSNLAGVLLDTFSYNTKNKISLTGSGSPIRIFADNYLGVVVVSSSELYAYKDSAYFMQLTTAGLDSGEQANILINFNEALAVSFDWYGMFVLTGDAIAIYPWNDNFQKGQITLANAVTDLINGEESVNVFFSLQCTCVAKTLVRFNCFSSTLKCIATISNSQKSCTGNYPVTQ